MVLLTGETWFFLLSHGKNYRPANPLVCNRFISDPLPWKRMGLARVEGERQSFRAKQGGKSKSSWRPGWQAPRWPEAGDPEAQWPKSQEHQEPPKWGDGVLCSEDLHSWWERRKKLHIDYRVSVVPVFLGGCDYPNSGMCGGLLAWILILLQTPFVYLVKHIHDMKQLIKIGALSKVIYGLFL